MPDRVTLAVHLDRLTVPATIDHEWLVSQVLTPLGVSPTSDLADLCEDILIALVSDDESVFPMRPGGWRLDVAGTTIKTALASAVLGAALFLNGSDEIPAELLPAVVPLLVDVKRVRLNRRDKELLIPLRHAAHGITGMAVSTQVLYNRLDPAIRAQLNFEDFDAFCTRLIEAGEMDDAGLGDVRSRPADQPAWIRVTWE